MDDESLQYGKENMVRHIILWEIKDKIDNKATVKTDLKRRHGITSQDVLSQACE